MHGSGELIQTLARHRLIDQYRLWIFPVIAGSGKRLFGDGTRPAGLMLTGSTVFATGVMTATYEPAGSVPTGSFG